MNYTVAVYGSLRQGLGNHRVLRGAPLVDTLTAHLPMSMVDLGSFPGLVKNKNVRRLNPITVEIYNVDEEGMQELDWLEGYPTFYNRELVEIEDYTCWIYYLAKPNNYQSDWVESGDWVQHIRGEAA